MIVRCVKNRRRRGGQIDLGNVTGHSHDFHIRRLRIERETHALPYRIFARKISLYESLIHDNHGRRFPFIEIVEEAAFNQRNFERREKARIHAANLRFVFLPGFHRPAFDHKAHSTAVAGKRSAARNTGAHDAGQRAQ